MKITGLYYYPIKSCAGIAVPSLQIRPAGPEWDREWVLVGAESRDFLSLRQVPRLQLVRPTMEENALQLRSENSAITLPLGHAGQPLAVTIWGDPVMAFDEGDQAAAWFSAICERPVRLVRMRSATRIVGKAGAERPVRFADSFPLHLCSTESLAAFNARATALVDMLQFRPNVVVSGTEAWAEDHWAGVEMGGERFLRRQDATRCTVTMVHPTTAARGHEPLQTLARFRKRGKEVLFGQYFTCPPRAELRVGEEITVY